MKFLDFYAIFEYIVCRSKVAECAGTCELLASGRPPSKGLNHRPQVDLAKRLVTEESPSDTNRSGIVKKRLSVVRCCGRMPAFILT